MRTSSTLFCVPHAGGSAATFRGLQGLLRDTVRVRAIELAGKGARAGEPGYADIGEAAADVARVIEEEQGTGGWAVLGHSMGGLIAYEAVRLLESRGTPGRLIVSACPPPQHGFGRSPDSGIETFLRSVGGLPREIAGDGEALSYYGMLLQADGALLSGYRFESPAVALKTPVTVVWGGDDPVTRECDPEEWEKAVGRPVKTRVLDSGRHLFVAEHPHIYADIVRDEFAPERSTRMVDVGAEMYLDLMKKVLTNVIYEDPPLASDWLPESSYDRINRSAGLDWPSKAHTMIGLRRLDNLQYCVEQVIRDGVPGDFIETGVWRGGGCIFMRALLRAHGVADRRVWCADSFQGMPEVGEDGHHGDFELATQAFNAVMGVSLDEVRSNFESYGLLDDQVRFVSGWFRDTLPGAPIERLALIRLDGDLYESTMDALVNLYPRLSVGGFVIIDDYLINVCKEAVHEFRGRHGITDEIVDIDGYGAYWRRNR